MSYLDKLIDNLNQIPGIGKKTSKRLAYTILKMSPSKIDKILSSILEIRKTVKYCKICYNFTSMEICDICSNEHRDKSTICVVEEPKDVDVFEKNKENNFTYHVLHGTISPLNGIGPNQLYIKELISRVKDGVKEVIMACNPTVEGEATSNYISKIIKPLGIKVTRIAYGIPIGANLEYTDEITLNRALQGRGQI